MQPNQVPVDSQVVARLIADQFPDWAALDVSQIHSSATVNAIFRIGPDLVARFPLPWTDPSGRLKDLEAEFESAEELATISTVATPQPVAIGCPGEDYPLPWSVHTWVTGHDATVEDPAASDDFALDLARLVREGRLAGLLDCGSFGPADPALDLVGAWHLLDAPRRALVRAELNSSEVQWNRGMAWAFPQAMGLVWYYAESNPTMSQWGRRTIERILAVHAGE